MRRSETELTYLRAAVQNASPAGLVVILLDQLVHDLRSAIAAVQERNVEKRSAELKHAFLVLQQLEGSLDMENGGEAAKRFSDFYAVIRASILQAHMKSSVDSFNEQIELLLDVRQAWQKSDQANAIPQTSAPAGIPQPETPPIANTEQAGGAGWSA